jgi:hypothetical protein
MKRFKIGDHLEVECTIRTDALSGRLYHVTRNASGGVNLTPVAYFFATRPEFIEGYHAHWRLDCFFQDHKLTPNPLSVGEQLVEALKKENLCSDPLWLSVHQSTELAGKAYGEVFDD